MEGANYVIEEVEKPSMVFWKNQGFIKRQMRNYLYLNEGYNAVIINEHSKSDVGIHFNVSHLSSQFKFSYRQLTLEIKYVEDHSINFFLKN